MSRPATETEIAAIKAYVSLDDDATQEMRQMAIPLMDAIDKGEVTMPKPYDDTKWIVRTRLRCKQERAVAEGDPYKYGPPPPRHRRGW